jgi:carboxypeptidase C (cathepsin A)
MRFLFAFFALTLFADDKISTHILQLENQLLPYTAVVGSLPAKNKEGEAKGEIHYISYVKEGSGRPLTFVFNGGPGSSSVWLHMGAFGPRRIVSTEEGQSVAPPYQIIDNSETILDLTDLIFVDPIGTGLSHANTPEDAAPFYDSFGDVQSIGDFIRDFLTVNKRWNCPIYLAGESYGTFRCCGLADYLQGEHGIYLNGLILISCAIDFQTIVFDSENLLPYSLIFPTYATTAWYHGRYRPEASLEEVAEESKTFAYDVYAPFLLRPARLGAKDREFFYDRLSQFTGIHSNAIKRGQGRIDEATFFLEFFPDEQKTLGRYDTRIQGFYTHSGINDFNQDPSACAFDGIFSGAFHRYLEAELESPVSYKLMSMDVNRQWKYKSYAHFGYPSFMEGLRRSIVANPALKVYVGMGYFDAATPFAAAEYCCNHLNLPDSSETFIQKEYYEGGHMYYLNPSARKKLKQDLGSFYGK